MPTHADLEYHHISSNGITLHVVTAGPAEGPMVLLLHGFPEFWYGWRHQIDALAARGYFVVVPDQRGYNLSERPRRVSSYKLDILVADVLGLAGHFQRETFDLVSHDWGGLVGWRMAMTHPERVNRFAVLNMPHPSVFERHMRTWDQLKRSWYVLAFQLPWIAERMLNKPGNLERTMRRNTVGGISDEDMNRYRKAWDQPGASSAMLAWYRAAIRHRSPKPPSPRVSMPTLIAWGVEDKALHVRMAKASAAYCDDVRVELIENAAHFVAHDAPDEINALLAEFLEP